MSNSAPFSSTDPVSEVFPVAADHPALTGHFPGRPLLPGVLLLDRAIRWAIRAAADPGAATVHIATARFSTPVLPGDELRLSLTEARPGEITATIASGRGTALRARLRTTPQGSRPE